MVQGFAIASSAASDSLQGGAFPARFLPVGALAVSEFSVPIGGTEWQVAVDMARALGEARVRAGEVQSSFLRLFLSGVAAAAVAGLCVVGLVWQTERLARQRSQFAASAAHELRTPLAGLRLYSDMLADGLGNPARSKEYAQRVAAEAERLGGVIANVLGYTRLERGLLKIHRQPGDLAAAVRNGVVRQQLALEVAGAQVELAIDESLPASSFDPDAMAMIIQNLLDNAEKHTRAAADRRIRVSVTSHEKGIAVAIGDQGPGIPARVRRRLFRPFARGNDTEAPAGLGLGLALAQALVRAHGGKIHYSDAPGGGAVFTAVFPL
jgi:signal transduction histidine kinase